MKILQSRGLLAATAICGLAVAGEALAGGSGMPWEGPIQQIVQSVTGPVVQAAAVIAVVIFGAGVAMSEGGSQMRRGLGILFGLSIAFAASTFFLDFFGFAGGLEIPAAEITG
jgi:type IV secretion system protein TrbC